MSGEFQRGMAVGRRLYEFRERLYRIEGNRGGYCGGECEELAAWCAALLDATDEGLPVLEAIAAALDAYDKTHAQVWADAARRRAADEAAYAEAVRKHELAVTVTCPFCGAEPGATCRTAGPTGKRNPKGVHDHAGRYRAAVTP